MPSSKSLTPGPAAQDHPAHDLRIGDSEDVQTLSKLVPVVMPNVATVESLIQRYPKDPRWSTFRNDLRYIYVMNWMYDCRGYIKLGSDHFDADLFEIELFDLVHPPPLDDMALMVNKAKLALLSKIHGKKVTTLGSFEPLFRIYFGSGTALGGPEDDEADDSPDAYPRYDDLYIDEKIDILYLMMLEVSTYLDFRTFIEKNNYGPDELRTMVIPSYNPVEPGVIEDYIVAFDGTTLYRRHVTVPEWSLPKKRKLSPKWPDQVYPPEMFDADSVTYELVFRDIYGLNDFIATLLPNKRAKKNRTLLGVINHTEFIANVFAYDIRKRKMISHKRKDRQMAQLLATRKRSSRLEAKEKQRHEEEEERRLRDKELEYASRRRSLRMRGKMDYTDGLTREERLNMRMQKTVEDSLREYHETVDTPEQTPEVQSLEVAESLTVSRELLVQLDHTGNIESHPETGETLETHSDANTGETKESETSNYSNIGTHTEAKVDGYTGTKTGTKTVTDTENPPRQLNNQHAPIVNHSASLPSSGSDSGSVIQDSAAPVLQSSLQDAEHTTDL